MAVCLKVDKKGSPHADCVSQQNNQNGACNVLLLGISLTALRTTQLTNPHPRKSIVEVTFLSIR